MISLRPLYDRNLLLALPQPTLVFPSPTSSCSGSASGDKYCVPVARDATTLATFLPECGVQVDANGNPVAAPYTYKCRCSKQIYVFDLPRVQARSCHWQGSVAGRRPAQGRL